MQFDLTRFPAVAISMAAVMSLVSGPSPSAARADYQARLVEVGEEASGQGSVEAAQAAGEQSKPSEPRDSSGKRSSLASFIAPASAKPAETDTSVNKAAAHALAPDLPLRVGSLSQRRPTRVASRQVRRPAFQANAPPSR